MINEFNGMCDELFITLLDSYNMKDWGLSWDDFLKQAEKELSTFFKTIDRTLD